MSIYTKSKTTVSNLSTSDDFVMNDDSIKVGIKAGSENIIIDYLTNLYANPEVAVCRELFTNAADASSDDLPVYIEINKVEEGNYSYKITDYGCGMSYDQLKDNYITYANSTKTEDYDTVGSFGLGSKSPMALVPKYTVESNNGKEQNIATVARTKNGIYANIKKSDNFYDRPFTSVYFDGLSQQQAKEMTRYTRYYIAAFSKQPVRFTSCIKIDYVVNDIFKLSEDVTLYSSSGIKKAIIKYAMATSLSIVNNFNIFARVNNIVYKLNNPINVNGAIVVDVEPGYFAFAPSREEVPEGEKKSHIIDIASKCVFEEVYDFVKFVTENGIFKCDEIFNYLFINKQLNISDFSCFAGATEEQLKKYKAFVEFSRGNIGFSLTGDTVAAYACYTDEFKYYYDRYPINKLTRVINGQTLASLIKHSANLVMGTNEDGEYIPYIIYKDLVCTSRFTIITGSKFKRKEKDVVIPRDYNITNTKEIVNKMCWETTRTFRNIDPNSSRHNVNYKCSSFYIYLKDDVYSLPEYFIDFLEMYAVNTNQDFDAIVKGKVEVVEYPKETKREPIRKIKTAEERNDNFEFYDFKNGERGRNSKRYSYGDKELIKKLKSRYKYYFVDSAGDTISVSSLNLISDLYNVGIITIQDRTKCVKNYLNSLGLKELVASEKLASAMKNDSIDKYIDGEYVASAIKFTKYSSSCEIKFEKYLGSNIQDYKYTYLNVLLDLNVLGCAEYKKYFRVKKDVCSVVSMNFREHDFVSRLDSKLSPKNYEVISFLTSMINQKKLAKDYEHDIVLSKLYKSNFRMINTIPSMYITNMACKDIDFIEILADEEGNKVYNKIDISELEESKMEYNKLHKYHSIYNSLSNDLELDRLVKEKYDEAASKFVESYNKLVNS